MRYRIDALDPPFISEDMREIFATYYAQVSHPGRMLASWEAPWRTAVVDAVARVLPISSLYELGCGAGPNLRLLRQSYPALRLGGCDFSQPMVDLATEYGEVTQDAAPCKVGPEWDVALTVFAFAYLDPQEVQVALRLIESPRLILLEPMMTGACDFHVPLTGALPSWRHDYLALLPAAGWRAKETCELTEAPDGLNRIVIAERGE